MTRTVSATEARVHFGELMRRVVEHSEAVYVARGGRPEIVVLSVSEYEDLLAGNRSGAWLARARKAREHVRAELGDRVLSPVGEFIREAREERDERFDSLR